MSLIKIRIKNYKSIGNCTLDLNEVTVLLGENGTGKSNILSAIRYFYDNLVSRTESDEIFDHYNHLNNRVEIALTYDLARLKCYSYANLKNQETRYKTYYEQITKLSAEDTITVKMVKVRDNPVRWSHNSEVRKLIAGLFPLYFVDARQIDLINWDILWKHIGDLMNLENELGKDLQDKIKNSIVSADEQLKGRLKSIERIFEGRNIKISQYSKNEFAAALSKMYFSGEQYGVEENKLSEFSNGTNSFNFTYLLIYILKIIAETKMKEPVMVLDEPEISLHNKMIDNLSEVFYECKNQVRFLMASHSARLVKDILVQDGGENQIYQIYQQGYETKISRFRMFRRDGDVRERYFITDQHASAYFSKALLLVEGETELEVFQNRFLRAVFPQLNQIEVIKGMSDDVVYRIVSPQDRKYHIPVTILMDIDKIYTYQDKLKQKYFNMCKSGENYYFFKKDDGPAASRAVLASRRNRIYRMAEKCKFHYEPVLYSSKDTNYWEFIQLIKSYFREYGIFVAKTTIEGLLVAEDNLEIFMEFFKEYYPDKYGRIYPFNHRLMNSCDDVPFIRLLLGGECDYGMRYKWLKENSKGMSDELKVLLAENSISKTSWVADWFRCYFCRQAGLQTHNSGNIYPFLRKMKDEKERERVRQEFMRDFPELGQLLQMVCRNVQGTGSKQV